MGATSRSRPLRERLGHFSSYLRGRGIDVGCGGDVLEVPGATVTPWDVPQGDGNALPGVPAASFDFVYSSHSLEHMRDVGMALRRWTEVLRPGGILFLVVPDYCLYEHMKWPSAFNGSHKHSFSLDIPREKTRRVNHFMVQEDLAPILESSGVDLLEAALEDDGYDYNAGFVDQTAGDYALAQIRVVGRKRA